MHLWETDADRLLDARLPSFVFGVFLVFALFVFLFSLVRFLPLAFRFFWVAFAVVA